MRILNTTFLHSCVVSALLLLTTCQEAVVATAAATKRNELNQEVYGPDVSWAIHSTKLKWNSTQVLYDDFMQECRDAAGDAASTCDSGEKFRLKMNRHQPSSMRNYTRLGFEKIKAPPAMFKLIKDFWNANREKNESEWHSINTYHNMWSSPPSIVNIQEPKHGGGGALTAKVWEYARHTLEEWIGMHLSPCSIWGIRIYHNNSILTTHVDRNPLVTSAIINVDQDIDEPWPLEVWGHDGMPYNITMEPGDMVMYESHSVLHGRPFPMRGQHYANIFVHFEPLGVSRREKDADYSQEMVYHEHALKARERGLPPYVIPDSRWSEKWHEDNPDGWKLLNNDMAIGVREGDLRTVDNMFLQNPDSIHKADQNGWNPLHEAVRAGHVHMTQYLFDKGLDLNTKTKAGQTALKLANEYHGEESEMYELLEEIGSTL